MDTGAAVQALRQGKNICRAGWNGKGMWLFLIPARDGGDLPMPMQEFVVMKTANGSLVPWNCSQSDFLANDWEISE